MRSMLLAATAAALLTVPVLAGPVGAEEAAARQAWFGELHLHTTFSLDAFMIQRTMMSPDDAYRFAKGEAVTALGRTYKRREPLDFMAVTDHAEQYAFGMALMDPDSSLSRSPVGQKARGGPVDSTTIAELMHGAAAPGVDARAIAEAGWKRTIDAANSAYVPGKFTTFIGYEWSSTPDGQNLHRNVIFRGSQAPLPFSARDSDRPEDLWTYLEQNRRNGIPVLAISHNANVSNGLMYDYNDSDKRPIDARYALRRALNEPLAEISQQKGQSETNPVLSPDDEFANFEIFDNLLVGTGKGKPHGSYAREGLGRGLEIAARIGVNPYRMGFVGGSDFHTGLSFSSPQDYAGATNFTQDLITLEAARKALDIEPTRGGEMDSLMTGPGNLTGVWAEANSREAIWDALARKETFATSGTRIKVRFFAGWSYPAGIAAAADWVAKAYEGGVPMGADLPSRPKNARAPSFIVWALKDPAGVNLDRVQVIKVWQDGTGHKEKVFDVARAPAGGAAELKVRWRDPDFTLGTAAVYYVRALEVPTPRWSTQLARRMNLPVPASYPENVQQRAWSSPIWYVPAKG